MKTILIGLTEKIYDVLDTIEGQVVVIDQTNAQPFVTFESEKVQALYQASLLSGQVNHSSFEDSFEFYDHISTQQFELSYLNKKELVEFCENKNIQVIKGRITHKDENCIEVSYLGETQQVCGDQIVDLIGQSEENTHSSPFVFTFDQFLNTNQLFKRIGVIAKNLRGLEIASMYKRFGSEVSLIVDRRYFTQINHLQFRDAIRESIEEQGIALYEKYEATQFEDLSESVLVTLTPQSNLAFEIGKPLVEETIEFDAVILEFDQGPSGETLFVEPALSLLNPNQEGEIVQIDCADFSYFKSRLDYEGGIEYRIFDNRIVGATFYCHNALDLKQALMLMTDQSLEEIKNLRVNRHSVLGVLKESAEIILKRKEGDYGQAISRLN